MSNIEPYFWIQCDQCKVVVSNVPGKAKTPNAIMKRHNNLTGHEWFKIRLNAKAREEERNR